MSLGRCSAASSAAGLAPTIALNRGEDNIKQPLRLLAICGPECSFQPSRLPHLQDLKPQASRCGSILGSLDLDRAGCRVPENCDAMQAWRGLRQLPSLVIACLSRKFCTIFVRRSRYPLHVATISRSCSCDPK